MFHQLFVAILFITTIAACAAFSPNYRNALLRSTLASREASSLKMAPRFDPKTEKWYATSPEDSQGYGPFGTLLRAGPKPLIIRLASPESYEQGVLKFMGKENMSRLEAQGNFDAYLENPNDWAYQYFQEKNGGYKKDYVNAGLDAKSLVLKGTWTALLVTLAGRAYYCYNTGINFYAFLKDFQ